jgi:hypothetical protein
MHHRVVFPVKVIYRETCFPVKDEGLPTNRKFQIFEECRYEKGNDRMRSG